MESEVKNFTHTFLMVLLVLAVYNLLVKQFTPTFVQSAIGI